MMITTKQNKDKDNDDIDDDGDDDETNKKKQLLNEPVHLLLPQTLLQ